MRAVAAVLLLVTVFAARAEAQCARADFEAVVAGASATLVEITQQNAPVFQSKLRSLREKRGWSQEQFLKDGAGFVRDDTIAGFDDKSAALLARINNEGGEAADCKSLDGLKRAMAELVETQKAKWAYMFAKIDRELAK